jgi:hypothetical protein
MNVSELTGELLDTWVARAAGVPIKRRADGFLYTDEDHPKAWQPSNFWEDAGPIIERAGIGVSPYRGVWGAWLSVDSYVGNPDMTGETPRIAAMRAFVASKFGDTVPDNE